MTEIFEHKKSPFYHFGQLMHLSKIPYDDFYLYIKQRLLDKPDCTAEEREAYMDSTVKGILAITNEHDKAAASGKSWDGLDIRSTGGLEQKGQIKSDYVKPGRIKKG